ncbi:hypothetical protein [Urechidicola croceus]|uniref:Uncharacterized protein n=1 Tax=Urechidicola croceus TaxID=1850246 RepID=A0A1D8P7E5_9FLAO|nr:hypothetical protein [Urechidicola croceus]AOW20505.1 hypothetical protein LPB138_07375 [Urechidicola croceus]
MEDNLEIFLKSPWLYFVGLILAGGFFFFKRKFENLADKDDVASITREVESVKNEFNNDLEKLKTNLDILKSNKINLINEKRKVINEFWSSLNAWDNEIDSVFYSNLKSSSELYILQNKLSGFEKDFKNKKSILNLYLYEYFDIKLIKCINEVQILVMEKGYFVKSKAAEVVKSSLKLELSEINIDEYNNVLDGYIEEKNVFNVELIKEFTKLKEELFLILNKIHQ